MTTECGDKVMGHVVIVIGELATGLVFIGPFGSPERAKAYAEVVKGISRDGYQIVPIESPDLEVLRIVAWDPESYAY